MSAKYRRSYNSLISMVISGLIVFLVCLLTGLFSSGASLASGREYDLIRYIEAVIEGRASIEYSFSGSAGQAVFCNISEIMFSPLNLVLAFTPHADFELIYTVVVIIKTALAACSCAAFINYRFFTRDNNKFIKFDIRHVAVIVISVFYSLSGITLEGGLLPADGMIFLPLIFLGVYKISIDKGAQTFVIAAILNMLCNWYTGLINLFCGLIWLLMEIMIQAFMSDGFVKAGDLIQISVRGIRFFISAVLSIGAGSILWFTSIRLLPEDTARDISSSAAQSFPGYFIVITGAIALVCFLVLNNCGYKVKIVVTVALALIAALTETGIMTDIVTGYGKIDPASHPSRYIIAMEAVFIFCLMFVAKNNFSKRDYVRLIFTGIALALMVAHIITGIVIPVKAAAETPHEPFAVRTDLNRTLLNAVKSLDDGAYRIGFVSEDLKEVTLVSSSDDNIYFEDAEFRISGEGDIIGACYPYAVKYFISKADLEEISGGNDSMGELEGYKVYPNSYYVPVAFVYDGSYFDVEFRESEGEDRLELAKETVMRSASGISFKPDDLKFAADAHQGEEMFISVPVDDNITVEHNGVTVVPRNYGGKFYTVSLEEGANVVTLTYSAEDSNKVLAISLISFLVLILFVFIENFYDMHYPER
ncbi:membrane protein YfhO [Ruminococcaceae bacterium YRB3002]|nr:membrane protein YfhO [Ruminococcaceae bacterium YRB3002]